jgi:hypothetical protein
MFKKQTFGAFALVLAGLGFLSGSVFGNTALPAVQNSVSQEKSDKTVVFEKKEEDVFPYHYENTKFGFGFSLPATWKGYDVKERILTAGDYENTESFDFLFHNEMVFNVSVHTKDAWKRIVAEEGPRPQYLAENNMYVFAYSMAQDGSAEVYKLWAEVPRILKLFEVK